MVFKPPGHKTEQGRQRIKRCVHCGKPFDIITPGDEIRQYCCRLHRNQAAYQRRKARKRGELMALYEGSIFYLCAFCQKKYFVRTNYKNEFFQPAFGVNEQFMEAGEKHFSLSTSCPECKREMEGYQQQREF